MIINTRKLLIIITNTNTIIINASLQHDLSVASVTLRGHVVQGADVVPDGLDYIRYKMH